MSGIPEVVRIPEVVDEPARRRARRWRDLSRRQKIAVVVGAIVQITLAVSAWTDLARRPAAEVNGPRGFWAVIIGINFLGPVTYFAVGRRR